MKAGVLVVSGSLGKTAVNVDGGATLAGIGTIAGSVNIAPGGSFTPGTPASLSIAGSAKPGTLALMSGVPADGAFGMLHIGDNLTLAAGSQYGVSIDAAGHNSLAIVDGTAAIDSAAVAIDARPGSYGRVTRYALLQADQGLTGTASATSNMASLEPWLTGTRTTLFMTLLRTDLPLNGYAATTNGAAIGSAFDRLRRDATGDLANVTRELTALDDPALAAALDALSGEIHASSLQLAALEGEAGMDLIRGQTANRAAPEGPRARSTAPRYSPWGNRRHWWTRFDAQQAIFGRTSSARGADAALQRFAFGTDRTFSEKWLAGAGGGYTSGRMRLDGIAESADFTAPRIFGYAGYTHDRFAALVGTSVTRTAYDTRRLLNFAARTPLGDDLLFGGVDRKAASQSSGLATDVWGEERFNAAVGSWSFSPSVSLRYARYGRHAWAESGADALSVSAPTQSFSSKQGDMGISVTRSSGLFRPLVSATYRRELGDRATAATLALSRAADGTFVVFGLPLARDTVVGRAGMTFRAGSSDLSLTYEWRGARAQMRQAIQFSLGFE